MWFVVGALLCIVFGAICLSLFLTLGAIAVVPVALLWAACYLAYHGLQRWIDPTHSGF